MAYDSHVCCVQASKLDRYMQRNSKGKLQGTAVHRYRDSFRPTPDSYDHGNKSFHMRRLLLKAEPQSGKTGKHKAARCWLCCTRPTLLADCSCINGGQCDVLVRLSMSAGARKVALLSTVAHPQFY